MKFLSFLISTLLFIGCGQVAQETSINDFENTIGKQTANEINIKVSEFEQQILELYNTESIEVAYNKHLENVIINFDEEIALLRKKELIQKASSQFVDEIWMIPDTAWIEEQDSFKALFLMNGKNDTTIKYLLKPYLNIDSLLKRKNSHVVSISMETF